MTDLELDARLHSCAEVIRQLCDDLQESDLTIDNAVVLGALLSCSLTLSMLCTTSSLHTSLVRSAQDRQLSIIYDISSKPRSEDS